MRIFITGAASPLGRALVAEFVRRGNRVIGLARRLGGVGVLRKLGAEPLVGDVRQPDALASAMLKCDAVIHLAGYFDFWSNDDSTYEQVNVLGTRHAMAAAIVARVPRLVLCSSAVTIGEEPGEEGFEWTKHRGYTVTAFERSKLEAERTAMKLRGRGTEVVVVNPGVVVSPSDPGWTGRLISDTLAGRRRMAGDAPVGWVWVGDAAVGTIRALERGKDGDRFILSGATLSTHEFLKRVAFLGEAPPPRRISKRAGETGARLASALAGKNRPFLPRDEARFVTTGFRVDGMHASRELGLHYTSVGSYLPPVVQNYRAANERFDR